MADADRCVCCGEIVPEGRQVCLQCENGTSNNKKKKWLAENGAIIDGKEIGAIRNE